MIFKQARPPHRCSSETEGCVMSSILAHQETMEQRNGRPRDVCSVNASSKKQSSGEMLSGQHKPRKFSTPDTVPASSLMRDCFQAVGKRLQMGKQNKRLGTMKMQSCGPVEARMTAHNFTNLCRSLGKQRMARMSYKWPQNCHSSLWAKL